MGFRKAEMRCLLASPPPLHFDPGLWYRLGAYVASADRVWLWRSGAGCVGGGCQFAFRELRKCLVFRRGSKCQ